MRPDIIKPEKSKFIRYFRSFFPFQKKRVGFYGYFGHGDLGDDASFIVTRKLLGDKVFPISKRCNAFNPHNLRALLIGGGAVLQRDYPFIPRRIFKKDSWNFPIILFSAGLNCDYDRSFTSKAKDKIVKLCRLSDYITVRDELTRRFLNSLGIDKVSILPHLELMLEPRPCEIGSKKKGPTIGIVLTPHPQFSEDTFEKIIDNFSDFSDYLTGKGYQVLYLPFELGVSENTKENEVISRIRQKVKNKDMVEVLEEDVSPGEMLSVIKDRCDFMVCMRLHSVVLAVNAAVPFFCITYNLMHKGFLQMLDMEELDNSIFDDFSSQSLEERFKRLLVNQEGFKAKLVEKRDYLRGLINQETAKVRGLLTDV